MSTLILDENPGLSEQDVIDLYSEYQNLDLTIYPRFPSYIDSTGHIDMWMMPLEDDKIIISEWTSGPAKTITDDATADLISRGYTVIRVPAWDSGPTHYTYTNAVIFNDLLFISWFGGSYVSEDAQVLAIYEAAMPNHQVIQVYCGSIIQAAGAIHCIMMHVPAYPLGPIPVVTVVSPNGSEAWTAGQEYDITWTAIDDVGVTGLDLYYSTDSGASYPNVIATGEPNDGVFPWTVPETVSDLCRVKIVAHDADFNSGEDVSDGDFTINPAPLLMQAFSLDSDPGWTTEGGWAFGVPTGGGSSNGDPGSGYTGTNVYGYNLSGDYDNNLPAVYLTTTAIDCSGFTVTQLRFRRWLGIEGRPNDRASIEVSSNGTDWTTIWRHTSDSLSESSWSAQVYDISAQADGQATVYLRWGMGPTNDSVTYPGWNIDDVEIWAVAPLCAMTGDLNEDTTVDGDDIGDFASCYLGGDPYAEGCACADADGSGSFDNSDITLFIEALLPP
ncbi:MAG: agmatine deiminase family protein [Dehalococcoidia bacterium]